MAVRRIECGLCLRIANPPLAPDEGNPLGVIGCRDCSQIGGKVADIHCHHLSIGNGAGAGA